MIWTRYGTSIDYSSWSKGRLGSNPTSEQEELLQPSTLDPPTINSARISESLTVEPTTVLLFLTQSTSHH